MTADPYRRLMLLRNYNLEASTEPSNDDLVRFEFRERGEVVRLWLDGSAYQFQAGHLDGKSYYSYEEGGVWADGPAKGQPVGEEEFIHLCRIIHHRLGGESPDAVFELQPPRYVRPVMELWDTVTNLKASQRILDVGCGTGWLVEYLRGYSDYEAVLGVEPSKERVALANMRPTFPSDNLIRQGVAENLPAKDNHFCQVVFWFSLHHVPEDQMLKALEEARRVIRGDGLEYVVVVEPVADGPMYEVEKLVVDEAPERAAALQALYQFGAQKGVTRLLDATIATEISYESPEEFLYVMGATDPERREAIAEMRDEVIAKFLEFGRRIYQSDEQRRVFPMDVRLVIFEIEREF